MCLPSVTAKIRHPGFTQQEAWCHVEGLGLVLTPGTNPGSSSGFSLWPKVHFALTSAAAKTWFQKRPKIESDKGKGWLFLVPFAHLLCTRLLLTIIGVLWWLSTWNVSPYFHIFPKFPLWHTPNVLTAYKHPSQLGNADSFHGPTWCQCVNFQSRCPPCFSSHPLSHSAAPSRKGVLWLSWVSLHVPSTCLSLASSFSP